MIDRRHFVLMSLAGALGGPFRAEAQQAAKVARIGWLGLDPDSAPHLRAAFLDPLEQT